jgi:hypothetical protein
MVPAIKTTSSEGRHRIDGLADAADTRPTASGG